MKNGRIIRTLKIARNNSGLTDEIYDRNTFKALKLLWDRFPDYVNDDLMYVTIIHHVVVNNWTKLDIVMTNASLSHLLGTKVKSYLNVLIANDYSVYNRDTVLNLIKVCEDLIPFVYVDVLTHCLYDKSQSDAVSAAFVGVSISDILAINIDSAIMAPFDTLTQETLELH